MIGTGALLLSKTYQQKKYYCPLETQDYPDKKKTLRSTRWFQIISERVKQYTYQSSLFESFPKEAETNALKAHMFHSQCLMYFEGNTSLAVTSTRLSFSQGVNAVAMDPMLLF